MRKVLDHDLADIVRACEAHRLEGAPRRAKLAKLKAAALPGRSRAAWEERRDRERKAEIAFIADMDSRTIHRGYCMGKGRLAELRGYWNQNRNLNPLLRSRA